MHDIMRSARETVRLKFLNFWIIYCRTQILVSSRSSMIQVASVLSEKDDKD